MLDIDLQNRIARKILHAFRAYFREFGDIETTVAPDVFGLTAADFRVVAERLEQLGLARQSEDDCCVATREGLDIAPDDARLNALFPVAGDPAAPLPSELRLFGVRSVEPAAHVPPPMGDDEYRAHVQQVWDRLLNSESQNDEAVFQRFLERHPCLLPEAFGCFTRGATPLRKAYFTQPELPGFRAKRPDFMTIMFDSEAVIALLIEIEAPAKHWVNQAGVQSAKLTQALDQLREWKAWFREPENVIQFTKAYQIDSRLLETHQFLQRYALVYGRRSEANRNPLFAKKRALIAQSNEVLMSYDRLSPCLRMDSSPTVAIDRDNSGKRFSVIHVPPTFTIGTYNADELFQFSGLREAIAANNLMSSERRKFLVDRCDYWEEWSRTPPVLAEGSFHTSRHHME